MIFDTEWHILIVKLPVVKLSVAILNAMAPLQVFKSTRVENVSNFESSSEYSVFNKKTNWTNFITESQLKLRKFFWTPTQSVKWRIICSPYWQNYQTITENLHTWLIWRYWKCLQHLVGDKKGCFYLTKCSRWFQYRQCSQEC